MANYIEMARRNSEEVRGRQGLVRKVNSLLRESFGWGWRADYDLELVYGGRACGEES
ncbi:MAG: hypothetical protein KJ718_03975 [Nanoarchaeota archaeon]|nr:hypothetical protein [Nanoarchaeota archaeon]MBU1051686.1 hypothetical protein [Nanoarchaeota archaeon]MBU1988871.1 hypothetical protein [Nanoarchaeota archaeon]